LVLGLWVDGVIDEINGAYMSAFVDLMFPVIGPRLPTDHGYLLYSAISRLSPCVHDGSVKFGLETISGQYVGKRKVAALDDAILELCAAVWVLELPPLEPSPEND
jgi:hypothetical protein